MDFDGMNPMFFGQALQHSDLAVKRDVPSTDGITRG
jgi:hypothetical protein